MRACTSWRIDEFENIKRSIKHEIDDYMSNHGPEETKTHLIQCINQLDHQSDIAGYMRRFVYIIHTLLLHHRFRLLSPTNLNGLLELAETILKVNGIAPVRSKLSRIYSDLLFVKSQLALSDGKVWSAAWRQQLAIHVSDGPPPGGEGFQNLSLGIKALRLGQAALSSSYLAHAEQYPLSPQDSENVKINRILALRLQGERQKAADLIKEILTSPTDLSTHFQDEVRWEQLCLDLTNDGNLDPFFKLCKPGSSHYEASYVLELYLWAYAVRSVQYQQKLRRLTTINRKKELCFKKYGQLFKFCCGLEEAYQADVSYAYKLQKMEQMTESIDEFKLMTHRLLAWLSIVRWLARNRSFPLASLALGEYRALCLKLSKGAMSDVLLIGDDLLAKGWFIDSQS